jgi:hypothetical protein
MTLYEFAQHKFDVLILLLLFCIECVMLVHASHHTGIDPQLQTWIIQGALGPTVGALLMALTSRGGGQRKVDTGKPPNGA